MKKEIIEINQKLGSKLNYLEGLIRNGQIFISKNKKYFTSENSLKAFNEMEEILALKQEEYNKMLDEYKKEITKIQSICNHELIIKEKYFWYCPLCNLTFEEIKDTSLFELTLSDFKIGYDLDIKDYFSQYYSFFVDNGYNYVYLTDDNIDVINKINDIDENFLLSNNYEEYLIDALEQLQYSHNNIKIRRLKR